MDKVSFEPPLTEELKRKIMIRIRETHGGVGKAIESMGVPKSSFYYIMKPADKDHTVWTYKAKIYNWALENHPDLFDTPSQDTTGVSIAGNNNEVTIKT